jgi:hypothetical protein
MKTPSQCQPTKNMQECNCSYVPCERKGQCCECLRYHRALGELPACVFPDDVERSFDRSYACFARTAQQHHRWW